MNTAGIRKIVVVGGGTAGWMAAAAFSKILGPAYTIELVESDDIGTVGVGEATVPSMLLFNEALGIDENTFMKETNATFKLGIQFNEWSALGSKYFHPFGSYGIDMNGINFTHFWLRYLKSGGSSDFGLFNPQTLAAREGRFGRTKEINPNVPAVNYAFHFDASLYARYLRKLSEKQGVVRTEGRITSVNQNPENGDVTSVCLENGKVISGDLFIDCSGFRGLLIEETLKSGYDDWSHWLPCNRAIAVPCEKIGPATPYTISTACEAGWQWRIPLQHRTGNGYVFCNEYLSEDRAIEKLMSNLDGKALAEPRVIKFVTGHRRSMWNKNVVALGLASGFLEPLESTSIYLVHVGIFRLLKYFPNEGISDYLRKSFNRELLDEYNNIKDFLIAHYKITERNDSPFWNYCRNMDIPESLQFRLDSFAHHNLSLVKDEEMFRDSSWFAVLAGQGLIPKSYHPAVNRMPEQEFQWRMEKVLEGTKGRFSIMPKHEDFIAKSCASPSLIKF